MISTLGSEGQICWFWISFNISEGVAFEKKLIWALLGQLLGRARSVHIAPKTNFALALIRQIQDFLSHLDSAGRTPQYRGCPPYKAGR